MIADSYMAWLAEPIALFVALMVVAPLGAGLVCRSLRGRPSEPRPAFWLPLAQGLTTLGWILAFALGSTRTLSYPASVLLAAVLYAPGLFLWGFHAQGPKPPQEPTHP